jgi:hypothetical protein
MTLKSILIKIIGKSLEDDSLEVVYAQTINGLFSENSEAVILKLNEEESELKINLISEKYCPDKEYFLEVFLIQEMLEGIEKNSSKSKIEKRIKTIIDYAENDA